MEQKTNVNNFKTLTNTEVEEERVDYNITKYMTEEERRRLIEDILQAEKEIENGEGIDVDVMFKEIRERYGHKAV